MKAGRHDVDDLALALDLPVDDEKAGAEHDPALLFVTRRTPVAFAASWARTMPATLFRSVMASASRPHAAA